MPDMLTVSSKFPDDILDGVQNVVEAPPGPPLQEVSGPVAFENQFTASGPHGEFLDLVAHSAGDDFLLYLGHASSGQISDFQVAAVHGNNWMDALKKRKNEIKQRGVKKIRLLGCLTAWEPAGRKAMHEIRTGLGLTFLEDVCGTINWIGADQFDALGFKVAWEHLLVCDKTIRGNYKPPGYPRLPDPPGQGKVLGLAL